MLGFLGLGIVAWTAIGIIVSAGTAAYQLYANSEARDEAKKFAKKELALKEKALDQSFAATRTFGEIQAQQQAAAASDNGQLIQWGVVGVMIVAVLFVLAGKK